MTAKGAVAAANEAALAVIWGRSGSKGIAHRPVGAAVGPRRDPSACALLPQRASAGNRFGWAVAALILVAMMMPGAAPARAAAPAPGAVRLLWTAPAGGTFSVDVPAGDLAAFLDAREVALDAEQARLAAIGSGTLESEISGTLTELMVRVPAYVDWVYDWIDGYITAFRVIGRGGHAWFASGEGGTAGLVPSVAEAVHEVSAEQLDKLIVAPVDPAARMQKAFSRVGSILADEWGRVLARDRSRWLDLLRANARTARSAAAASEGIGIFCTTDPPAAQTLPFDAARLATASATGQDAFYFWRITRPFATRLGALATRLAIGTASLTGGSVVGLGSTTTAGTALSFLATSGVVWTIDYGLNELDALLHRDLLTAQVSVGLANALRRQADQATSQQRARIQDAFAALVACTGSLRTRMAAY
jgi:hypothetical protein